MFRSRFFAVLCAGKGLIRRAAHRRVEDLYAIDSAEAATSEVLENTLLKAAKRRAQTPNKHQHRNTSKAVFGRGYKNTPVS